MRRLVYNAATTLDGFIASPDGSTDWILDDPAIDFDALYARFDIFLMGRKTYQAVTTHGGVNPLASKSRDQVFVVSHSMKQEDHPHVTILRGDYVETVQAMKQAEGKDIWFMGGAEMAASLLAHEVLDGMEMAIMPCVLGNGVRMVARSEASQALGYKLALCGLESLDQSGIVLTKYDVVYDC